MGLSNSTMLLSDETEGYNILKVQDGSPAQMAGLEPYFDFILAIGTSRLSQDNESMKTILKSNVDKQVKVTVFSSRTNLCREVIVIPSTGWGGAGLLGVSIRFCSIRSARETVWHILDVAPNSPAAESGLVAQHDYIVGSDALLMESEDFFSLVETYDNRQLKLFVYNSLLNTAREVTLTPRSDWGGPGALGCGIGYGYLHRIPAYLTPSQQCINKLPDVPPPPYTAKESTHDSAALTNDTKSSESSSPAKVGSLDQSGSILPPMVTSVNLPGLPPLNVSVPSISIDAKTCTGEVLPTGGEHVPSQSTNIPQSAIAQS